MLRIENLHLYYGASHALRGVGLEAAAGRVTCVLERNGVGKTSLLQAILGLVPVRKGRIYWEDRPIEGDPVHWRARAGIGNVPQGRETSRASPSRRTCAPDLQQRRAASARCRSTSSSCSRCCARCCAGAAAISPAASSSS